MKSIRILPILLLIFTSLAFAQTKPQKGKLVTRVVSSTILKENRLGLNTDRSIKVYLPPGYETSGKSYPTVYFLHNIFWDNDKMFEDGVVLGLIERAITERVVREFILVVPDYRTAGCGSLYENSVVSGRWLDHTIEEIVPYIDKNFRTIGKPESRAITGEFMGGRGALKMAMEYPTVFSSVYALHPVATGMGVLPWIQIGVEWQKLYNAKSYPVTDVDGRSQIFVAVSQAWTPNVNRAPLYCDFFMESVNGRPTIHPENMKKARDGFIIGENLDQYGANLRKLKAVAFDWARFDPTYAHVDSNREFSRKLSDVGVVHEAEEYAGNVFEKTWLDDGRFYTRVLPFLEKHLVFDGK